jgi:hypothetical protein
MITTLIMENVRHLDLPSLIISMFSSCFEVVNNQTGSLSSRPQFLSYLFRSGKRLNRTFCLSFVITARSYSECALPGAQEKRGLDFHLTPFPHLAGSKGLEPSASGVTGRRYNRLNYDPVYIIYTTCNSMKPVRASYHDHGRRNRT